MRNVTFLRNFYCSVFKANSQFIFTSSVASVGENASRTRIGVVLDGINVKFTLILIGE